MGRKYIFSLGAYFLLNVPNIISFASFQIEKDLYDILYPNYMNFSNEYILPLDSNPEEVEKETGPELKHHLELVVLSQLMTSNESDIVSNELDEYMTIATMLNNTRRGNFAIDYGDADGEDPKNIEAEKKQILININLQFIIHTRYLIAKAMKLKEGIRYDKRYKLGYLFNRMRRLKYEQLKIISNARYQNMSYFRKLEGTLRYYERVVRLDVDMRDTARHIKKVFKEKAIYDRF